MSNIGKSHRTHQIKRLKGFKTKEIDDQIGEALGLKSLEEMAEWMGQPYTERFLMYQKKYLDAEEKLTQSAIENAEGNFLIDTTGSVVYLSDNLHQKLSENFLVVQFDAAPSMREEMTKAFFEHPKPIIWGESFQRNSKESKDDALKRCYPSLLELRRKKYFELSDIIIPGEVSRHPDISAGRFFEILRNSLPKE